jgi:hypothetical protein
MPSYVQERPRSNCRLASRPQPPRSLAYMLPAPADWARRTRIFRIALAIRAVVPLQGFLHIYSWLPVDHGSVTGAAGKRWTGTECRTTRGAGAQPYAAARRSGAGAGIHTAGHQRQSWCWVCPVRRRRWRAPASRAPMRCARHLTGSGQTAGIIGRFGCVAKKISSSALARCPGGSWRSLHVLLRARAHGVPRGSGGIASRACAV